MSDAADYAFSVTVYRYPVNEDGSRGTGVQILQVYTNDTQYFDLITDVPGAGTWIYGMNVNTTLGTNGQISRRTMVGLVAKR